MVAMVSDAEMPFDDFRDAGRCPEIGAISVCPGAFAQQPCQVPALAWRELVRPARRGPDPERFLTTAFPGLLPAHYRTSRTPDQESDFVQRSSLVEKSQGSSTAVFKKLSRSFDTHDGDPPNRPPQYDINEMLHCLCRENYNALQPMSPGRDRRPRQRELLLPDPEWEDIVTEDRRRNLRGRLAEMLRACFRETLSREGSAADADREDSSNP